METKYLFTLAISIICLLTVSSIFAVDITVDRANRLTFDHLLYISNIMTMPAEIAPGQTGVLSFDLTNTGTQPVRDVIANLNLPAGIAPFNDVNNKKIADMAVGETKTISFNLIALPSTDEGVYQPTLNLKYVNYIGDEKDENSTLGLVVGSSPELIAELKSTEIYDGNPLGNVDIKVINNNPSNVKFLKVQILPSKNYEIFSADLDYIGDLNSDDFSDATFKIKISSDERTIPLPIVLTYEDALNREYTRNVTIQLKVLTAKEAGIATNSSWVWIVILILIVGGYFAYRKFGKNMIAKEKKALVQFKSKF